MRVPSTRSGPARALCWLALGNAVAALAWKRRVPINTGVPSLGLAATIYAAAALDRLRAKSAPLNRVRGHPGSLLLSALAGVVLAAPALVFFRQPIAVRSIDYAPIQRLSRRALAARLLLEIPLYTAFPEEWLFREHLYANGHGPLAHRVGRNALTFTGWHLVVTLRTVCDAGVRDRPLVVLSYIGALFSVFAGAVLLCLVREKGGSFVHSALTHWSADAALTLGVWRV